GGAHRREQPGTADAAAAGDDAHVSRIRDADPHRTRRDRGARGRYRHVRVAVTKFTARAMRRAAAPVAGNPEPFSPGCSATPDGCQMERTGFSPCGSAATVFLLAHE